MVSVLSIYGCFAVLNRARQGSRNGLGRERVKHVLGKLGFEPNRTREQPSSRSILETTSNLVLHRYHYSVDQTRCIAYSQMKPLYRDMLLQEKVQSPRVSLQTF